MLAVLPLLPVALLRDLPVFWLDLSEGLDVLVASIFAILYSRGSKNSNISSRVGSLDEDAVCLVHSSRNLGSKSSKARTAKN